MDNLPIEVIRQIYEYDSTYNIKFDKVLNQLFAHIFISDVPNVSKNGIHATVTAKLVELI